MLAIFHAAEVGRNPTFPGLAFLSREWKIWCRALELAIQIPQRSPSEGGHHGNGHDLNGATGDARPDFLCVGAQKAGTSWLYQQLEPHPDFWMPPVKELHYFDQPTRTKQFHPFRGAEDTRDRFGSSKRDERSSMRNFISISIVTAGCFLIRGRQLSGDISPAYSTLTDEIIERVVNHFPNMKVVFLARDPVERAWSQLSMGVRLGMINKFDATNPEEVICNLLNPGVLVRSRPSKIVRPLETLCSSGKLPRIYFFDDLKENPAELRQSILRFLGGDPDKPSGGLKPHDNNDAGRDKLRLTAKVRDRMAQFFEHELKACASELGSRAKSWPTRYGFSTATILLGSAGRQRRSPFLV